MTEDHMMNGQLKAEYNLQIAIENYFIIQTYVSNDQTAEKVYKEFMLYALEEI